MEADSRVPYIRFSWKGVGGAEIFYREDWLLKWNFLFFGKTMELGKQSKKKKFEKPVKRTKKKEKKKMQPVKMFRKIVRVIKTFRVDYWQLAIDTGDNTLNAKLYPANFLPGCRGHLQVNFNGVNHLRFRIRNRAWNVLIAWFRK